MNTFRLILPFFLFSFMWNCSLSAQDSTRQTSDIFTDWNVGLLIADEFKISAQYAVGIGYAFSPPHGLGLEYRGASTLSCCNQYGMSGIGALYRFTTNRWYSKLSFGKVFHGNRGGDFSGRFNYKKGGRYLSVNAGYRLKKGLILGAAFTSAQNMKFDYFTLDIQGENLVFDRIENVDFPVFTLLFAFIWPK